MLEYIALALLVFVALILFYGIIAIHDIPYEIAKHRNHPQQDALHVAGWVSLFTLHVLWPFLWIWATLYRPDRGWGFAEKSESKVSGKQLLALQNRIELLEMQLVSQRAQASSSASKALDDGDEKAANVSAQGGE